MGFEKTNRGASTPTVEAQRIIMRLLSEAFSGRISEDKWRRIESAAFEEDGPQYGYSTTVIPPELAKYPLTLSVDHVSEIMHLSRPLILQKVRSNQIPHLREGRRILIPRDAFWEWYNTTALSR